MEQEEKKKVIFKKGFFRKVWYSISKIEKYPEMATEGVNRAIIYLLKLVAILAIVVCLGMIYQTHNMVEETITYIQNEFPDFTYQEGSLKIDSDKQPIKIDNPDSPIGKVIVDTTEEMTEEKMTNYTNEIIESGEGIVVLKEKVILKNKNIEGMITYQYKDTLQQVGVNEFNKQDIINFTKTNQMVALYLSLFVTIFIYAFIIYIFNTLLYVLLISIFGYIANMFVKMKMRYAAIFNMSIYAITLGTILNMIYIAVNTFIPFYIEYFQVMYVSVSVIYLIAAIFILKSEFIKKQAEVAKIVQVQKIIEQEQEKKQEENKEETKENKETKEPETQDRKEKEEHKLKTPKEKTEGEPNGSEA